MITQITIVTGQGVKSYSLGDDINGRKVEDILLEALRFQGDPFDHYVGRSSSGEMLFSINCLVPCVIEYKH